MATNEDDLYGDLDDAVVNPMPSMNNNSTTSKVVGATSMMTSEPEVRQLLEQMKKLKAENDILKRNMGILYRTAKSELDRKDRAIFQLQNELDSLQR
jgi:hypothetical protein